MKSIVSLVVAIVSMAVLSVEATAVYTYENDDKTYIATVTEADEKISSEALAVLNSNDVTNFVKRGSKVLILNAGNSFAGDICIEGPVRAAATGAMGTGPGTIHVKESHLTVNGCTIDKDTFFDCPNYNDKTRLIGWAGKSIFTEKVTFGNGNFSVYPYSDCEIVFENGLEGDGYMLFRGGSGGKIVIRNKPLIVSNPISVLGGKSGAFSYYLVFETVGNVLKALGNHNGDNWEPYCFKYGKLSTVVDWAFDNPDQGMNFGDSSLWDLCGTSQRVGLLDARTHGVQYQEGQASIITNSLEKQATLYLNQSADTTPAIIFGGNLSVDFAGTKTTTIAHEMTATGELSVSGGKLVFTKDGKWAASKVSIADGAAMEISSASTFPREAELSLDGTGALSIAAGEGGAVVTQTVEFLTMDGIAQKRGFYPMGEGVLEVVYSGACDITDETLVLGAQEKLMLDESVKCGIFDSITLGDGAELEVATDIYFPGNAEFTIAVGVGGKLKLSEEIGMYATSVTVGGVKLQPGRYTAENADWLDGDGAIYIPYGEIAGTEVQWIAKGADNLMTTAGNWAEDNVDLNNGATYARFVSGEKAVVGGSVFLNGISFETTSAFTVSAANDSSLLRLASGGISAVGAIPKISASVSIDGSQMWSFPGLTVVSGALKSDPLARYTLRLEGGVDFTGGGDYAGDIYSVGALQIRGGKTFGSGSGLVTMAPKKTLVLQSSVLAKDVLFANWDSSYGEHNLSIWGNGKSVLKGALSFGNRNLDVNVYQNSELEFEGGIEDADANNAGYLYFKQSTGAKIIISSKPVKVRKSLYFKPFNQTDADGFSGHLVLAVAGNEMSSFGYVVSVDENYSLQRTKLETIVDGAFENSAMKFVMGGNSLWDLCGSKQRIGHLDTKYSTGEISKITSSTQGAKLYVKQTADSTMNVVFAGQLSVEFSGAKTTTIANEMTSSGSVAINEGVLNFDTNGSWRQAESVAAKGDAKIVLSASHNLGRKTNVELASESSLEIAAGAAVRVAELTVGGGKCANGRYRFGDGELLVGPQGFKMIVR